jgi:hypothetical protein
MIWSPRAATSNWWCSLPPRASSAQALELERNLAAPRSRAKWFALNSVGSIEPDSMRTAGRRRSVPRLVSMPTIRSRVKARRAWHTSATMRRRQPETARHPSGIDCAEVEETNTGNYANASCTEKLPKDQALSSRARCPNVAEKCSWTPRSRNQAYPRRLNCSYTPSRVPSSL